MHGYVWVYCSRFFVMCVAFQERHVSMHLNETLTISCSICCTINAFGNMGMFNSWSAIVYHVMHMAFHAISSLPCSIEPSALSCALCEGHIQQVLAGLLPQKRSQSSKALHNVCKHACTAPLHSRHLKPQHTEAPSAAGTLFLREAFR